METQTINTQTQTEREPSQSLTIQSVSISPSIAEIERFISYLNQRFKIKPSNDLIVLIQKTEPQIKGYYSPNSWRVFKHENENSPSQPADNINEITLSSVNLTFEPYETIAHEYSHFLNTYLDNYKGNCRNYHTLDFKKRAEQMLLRVEKGNYGFNQTFETEAFKEMIADFKPNPTAFKIFQPLNPLIVGIDGNGHPVDKDGNIIKPTPKGNTRLNLLICECGYKIRASKSSKAHPSQPLKAVCGYCNTEFKAQPDKNDIVGEPTPTENSPSHTKVTPPISNNTYKCSYCETTDFNKPNLSYCPNCKYMREHKTEVKK